MFTLSNPERTKILSLEEKNNQIITFPKFILSKIGGN